MMRMELLKVKGSEKEVLNLETMKEECVAFYTDTGLKSRFAVAVKLSFKEKPLPERVVVHMEVAPYEGPPSPEEVEELSRELGEYWKDVDVEEEIRRLRGGKDNKQGV